MAERPNGQGQHRLADHRSATASETVKVMFRRQPRITYLFCERQRLYPLNGFLLRAVTDRKKRMKF